MGALRYSMTYATSYALLQLVDAWLSVTKLPSETNEELNPLGNSGSFAALVFEPLNLAILCLCSAMVFIMESNRQRAADVLRSEWGAIMSTPFVLLAMKFLSVFNSTLSYTGLNAPATMFGIFSNQQMFFIILLFIVIAMVLHLPVTKFLKKRYSSRS
jgi:hypothetical protein